MKEIKIKLYKILIITFILCGIIGICYNVSALTIRNTRDWDSLVSRSAHWERDNIRPNFSRPSGTARINDDAWPITISVNATSSTGVVHRVALQRKGYREVTTVGNWYNWSSFHSIVGVP